jgi:hypothetical protein
VRPIGELLESQNIITSANGAHVDLDLGRTAALAVSIGIGTEGRGSSTSL